MCGLYKVFRASEAASFENWRIDSIVVMQKLFGVIIDVDMGLKLFVQFCGTVEQFVLWHSLFWV